MITTNNNEWSLPDSALTQFTPSYTYSISSDCAGVISAIPAKTHNSSWNVVCEDADHNKSLIEDLRKSLVLLEKTVDMMEQNIDYLSEQLKVSQTDILAKEEKIQELTKRILSIESKNTFLMSENQARKVTFQELEYRLEETENTCKTIEGQTLSNELYIQELLKGKKETEGNGERPSGTSSNDK